MICLGHESFFEDWEWRGDGTILSSFSLFFVITSYLLT